MNVPQKTAPGNQAIAFGDSHLQWINTKLFNESLPNCRGSLKYFI